jgi:hypothetical protein
MAVTITRSFQTFNIRKMLLRHFVHRQINNRLNSTIMIQLDIDIISEAQLLSIFTAIKYYILFLHYKDIKTYRIAKQGYINDNFGTEDSEI